MHQAIKLPYWECKPTEAWRDLLCLLNHHQMGRTCWLATHLCTTFDEIYIIHQYHNYGWENKLREVLIIADKGKLYTWGSWKCPSDRNADTSKDSFAVWWCHGSWLHIALHPRSSLSPGIASGNPPSQAPCSQTSGSDMKNLPYRWSKEREFSFNISGVHFISNQN